MGYREVTMVEVKEVLRLWLGGVGKSLEKGVDELLKRNPSPR
jgi:hypothetical protein